MNGPVLGIAGPPGSGKSTLVAGLVRRLGAVRVAFDDFETMTRCPPSVLHDWIARGAPLDEVTAPGFAEAIVAAKGLGGPVVVESPLGRSWPPTAGIFDWCAWIECPSDVALARKAGALLARPGHADERLNGAISFLMAYPNIARPALAAQAASVPATCDAVLDGMASDRTVLDAAEAAMRALRPWV